MQTADKKTVEELQDSNEKILLDFYADWCGPCRALTPLLQKMEEEYPDVKFLKVNVDLHGDYAVEYGVTSIPTVLVMRGKELVDRIRGMNSADVYKKSLSQL